MIIIADGRIIIDTKIDNSGAEKGIGDLGKIASSGLKVAAGAVAGFGVALGGISAYAIKTGMDFEATMSKVQAISGATGQEIVALTDKAKEMGAKTKFSATESADAFVFMSQAGWKTTDMLNGIEGVMNLAAASGEDLANTSEIVTSGLTAFGLQAKDSAHFADVLARAAADSNTDVGSMGYTFKYVAPIAGALKYNIEDTALAIELMANAGIRGETAGTSLRSILTRMVDPPKAAAQQMEALGLSMTNANGTMKPLNEVLLELRQKFSGLNDSQKVSAASAIAGKEAMSGLLAIVNASDKDFNTLSQSINNANGSAAEMAKTMQDNLKGKVEQLGGSLETLALTMYDKFQGPMKTAVDAVSKAIDTLNKSLDGGQLSASADTIAQGFSNLVQGTATFITDYLPKMINGLAWIMDHSSEIVSGLAGIGASLIMFNVVSTITNLIGVLNGTAQAIGIVAKAQMLLNAVMAISPIGWIVIAITGLVAAIVVLWNTNEGFRNAVIGAWNAIKQTAGDVWNGIVSFFTETIPQAFQSLLNFFGQAPGFFGGIWTSITTTVGQGVQAVISWFASLPGTIWGFLVGIVTNIVAWGASVYTTFTTWIGNAITAVVNFFVNLPYNLGYALGFAIGTIVNWGIQAWTYLSTNVPIWIDTVVNFFATLPGRIWTWLVNTINNIITWGGNVYNTATTWISNTVNGIINWFSQLPGRIWAWLVNTINSIAQWGSSAYSTATTWVSNTVNGIINWFSQLPGRIWSWLSNTISSIIQWGSNMASQGRQGASNLVSNVVSTISSLPGKMADIGRNIVQGIWNGITGMGGWLMDKVGSFVNGIVDGFKAGLGIHSPSRIMRDVIGTNMVKGIGVGIDYEMPNLNDDIDANMNDLVAKLKTTVDYETARTTAGVAAQNNYSVINNSNYSSNGSGLDTVNDIVNNLSKRPIQLQTRFDIDGKTIVDATNEYSNEVNAGKVNLASRGIIT